MTETAQDDFDVNSPEISVCLAAYNGERFIHEQVESILAEIGPEDELIVCDDCSTDSTRSIIMSFNDPRIILISNSRNLGHIRTFEKIIALARGRYLFLSDQDDIWVGGKVRKVLAAFSRDDNISLVYHNIKPIDVSGNILTKRFPHYSDGTRNSFHFVLGQLIRPTLFGCACALDRSRISTLLPFPATVYAHDHWIAVWAAINGKIRVISDVLVYYRQHASNLTPSSSPPLRVTLKSRMRLLRQIGISLYRRYII